MPKRNPSPLSLPSRRTAVLQPLTGADEEVLLDIGPYLLSVQWTTEVLGNCLTHLDDLPASPQAVMNLTVGDREALLLHLHRLTFGEHMACVLTCPACGEKLDVDLRVSDLLLPPSGRGAPRHRLEIELGEGAFVVTFRLPSGADQEVISEYEDVGQAARAIMERCLEKVIDGQGKTIPPEAWPAALIAQVEQRMADLDPQAELRLDAICPACEHAFSALLDMATFLRKEMAGHSAHLYQEVHLLALYYHWSEAEILALPTTKRRRYLDLLESALSTSLEESDL